MKSLKRTAAINLDRMRKNPGRNFVLRPIALGIVAALMGCSSKEEVKVVASVADCVDQTELDQAQCEAAYQQALQEAERTGPKYDSRQLCEAEFGNCRQSGSFFLPLMTGFMVGQMLDGRDRRQYYNPVYRYTNPYSGHYDRLMTSDGSVIGRSGKVNYTVPSTATKPKPTVTKTVSRGGFGSVASAKSSWGGGRSGGWGG
ncbi:DUF1190 domain-containing protein [Microbulbifer harenosus]|uniref:DUF1190 domain-containing protein n=1 Tax=Microbulbifer harenosus TaxID=2576840 RepID=A0ABY2UNS0_9GAMM|nr:DUF1190 domain-containing protein [Microbulbifer harenosus]TLM77713.1 DUF1190 domain-containing protein [Microbulbifer harenosus]